MVMKHTASSNPSESSVPLRPPRELCLVPKYPLTHFRRSLQTVYVVQIWVSCCNSVNSLMGWSAAAVSIEM